MVSRYHPGYPWHSVSKTLKGIRRLQIDRCYRDGRGAFFIEGVRNFVQVVDHDLELIVIIYSEKLLTNPLARKSVRQSRRAGAPTVGVSPEGFRSFSQDRRASGVGAIVRQRWARLDIIHPNTDLC